MIGIGESGEVERNPRCDIHRSSDEGIVVMSMLACSDGLFVGVELTPRKSGRFAPMYWGIPPVSERPPVDTSGHRRSEGLTNG